MVFSSTSRSFAVTFFAFALLLLWDVSGADIVLARWAGTSTGFPLRSNKSLDLVLHEIPRIVSWVFVVGLLAAIRWPVGVLRRIDVRGRVQMVVTVLVSVLATSLVKAKSHTSCPWDLAEFGGMARYVSHWAWGIGDGGPGKCFPAGHASAAFAYLGGWFVLRRQAPEAASTWLGIALASGLVLGLAQQARGAHYMSHTLWTAWLCWSVGFAIDGVFQALRKRTASLPPNLNDF